MGISPDEWLIEEKTQPTKEESDFLLAQRHYFMGCYHLQLNQAGRAQEQFLKAMEFAPNNNYILLAVAKAKLASKEYGETRKFTTKVLDNESTNVQAMQIEADSYLIESDGMSGASRDLLLTKAIARLEEAKRIVPKNMEVLKSLAKAYIQTQNINKIIDAYKEIVVVNPKDTYSLLLLGQVLTKLDRNREAVEYFEKVIEQRRGFLGGYVSLAEIYRKLNQNKKALDILKQGVLVEPTNTELLKTFEDFLRNIYGNRNQKAILDQYAQFAKEYPFNSEVQRIYAERLEGEELFERAIEQYKKVLVADPENSAALISLGKISLKEKKYAAAVDYFTKAIDIAPDRLELYDAIAAGYLGQNQPEMAVNVYVKAIESNPKSDKLYISLAALYDQEKQSDKAIELLNKGLKEIGEKPELLAVLGRFYIQKQETDKAIEVWRKAYEQTPESVPLYSELASLYIKKNDAASVESILKLGSEKLSDKKDLLLAVTAEAYQLEGMTTSSIKYYKQALDLSKNKIESLSRLISINNQVGNFTESWALYEKYKNSIPDADKRTKLEAEIKASEKKYDEAAQLLRGLISKNPKELDNYNILIDIYNMAGKFSESLKVASEAEKNLGLTGKNEILIMRGLIYYKAKRLNEAEKTFSELRQQTNGENDDVYFFLGSIALERKQYNKAEAAFKKAIELNPLSANALNALGFMYADQNIKLDEAQKLIQSALDLNPSGAHIVDSMGWILYRQGKFEDALKWIQKALRLSDEDADILDHLGDVYKSLNKLPEAKEAYQKSLKVNPENNSVKKKLKDLN